MEIMFEDFIAICFDGILNSIAKMKFIKMLLKKTLSQRGW